MSGFLLLRVFHGFFERCHDGYREDHPPESENCGKDQHADEGHDRVQIHLFADDQRADDPVLQQLDHEAASDDHQGKLPVGEVQL